MTASEGVAAAAALIYFITWAAAYKRGYENGKREAYDEMRELINQPTKLREQFNLPSDPPQS